MLPSRIRALTLAVALVGWNGVVAPRLPPRWLVPVHAALGGALVATTDAPLGLRPPAVRRGVRLGLAVAGAVAVAVASSTTVPPIRRSMNQRELPRPVVAWLLVRIPIGTVWSEEAAFRGALGTVATQAVGLKWGRVLQATAFGLSHVDDARGAGESIVGTVLVTAAAGWAFGWLYDRSGSLAAPMLAHLAINEAGAVAALAVTSTFRD
ncbi:MAG TPA: CPBP family intramembrane glutamic endopeptidase [Mycobacterium sp.]|nr:CPBP family intramembrane glutamic endopeptidase [Mycobacterium sp.]